VKKQIIVGKFDKVFMREVMAKLFEGGFYWNFENATNDVNLHADCPLRILNDLSAWGISSGHVNERTNSCLLATALSWERQSGDIIFADDFLKNPYLVSGWGEKHVKLSLTQNGREIPLSSLSEKTLLNLRNQ